jgi:hypothetical protein
LRTWGTHWELDGNTLGIDKCRVKPKAAGFTRIRRAHERQSQGGLGSVSVKLGAEGFTKTWFGLLFGFHLNSKRSMYIKNLR